jgi:hypothetical protein
VATGKQNSSMLEEARALVDALEGKIKKMGN